MKRNDPAGPRSPAPAEAEVQQILYPYGVGIDTHSRFIQTCVLKVSPNATDTKSVLRFEAEFKTDWRSLKKAHKWVLRHLPEVTDPAQLRYCIESTGCYHLPVLKAWGGVPCVVNPLLAGPTRRKTDVLDARLLAHHSITGVWKPSFIPTERAQVLRVLWAARREAARRATRCSNRLNNIVLRFGHTFGADCSMRSCAGEGILSDLVEGKAPPVPGVAPDGLPPEVRPVVGQLLAEMKAALKEVYRTTVTAQDYVCAHDWPTAAGPIPGTRLMEFLQTVPGVGLNTALGWLSEVADPRRFQDAKQVAAYCGCDPSLKVSAGKVTSYVRRQGNSRLHQALLYAASGVLRQVDSPLGQWGRSIAGRHKKGGYRKACGALGRRIACGLWHVHRKGEAFRYDDYRLAQKLVVPDRPLGEFLKPKAVKLLKGAGIRTTAQLAEAYTGGKLAAVFGLGQQTIADIKKWILRRGRTVKPAKPNHGPGTQTLSSSGKGYVLDPCLKYHPKGTSQKQGTPPANGQRPVTKGK